MKFWLSKAFASIGKRIIWNDKKNIFFFFEGEEKYPLDYFKAKSVIIQLSHLVIFKECVYDSNLFFPFKKKKTAFNGFMKSG